MPAALTTLRALHAARNHRPVAHTIGRLIEATRAHAGFILWKSGEQVLANVLHISDLARQYEAEGGLSFRGFVETLRVAAGKTQTPEAPVLEEGSEGVRLMTVHKAKGLEFPIVMLADIGCRLSQRTASRVLDTERNLCAIPLAGLSPLDLVENNDRELRRDEAEGVRLAYVAATRARDLLVVPAVGDGPFENGWIRPLNRALYPPVDERQQPQAARACPPFPGKDTVLERPDGQQPDASTVRPGAYALQRRAERRTLHGGVVGSDPARHARRRQSRAAARGLDLKGSARGGRRRGPRALRRVARAQSGRDRAGARPSLAVMTATEWVSDGGSALKAAFADITPDMIAIEDAGVDGPRPSGKRFGVLVHALLAVVPLDADGDQVRELARLHARVLGAPDDERDAAARLVHRVLGHQVLHDARAAGPACRREAPVSIVLDGTLVDGQVDLAFETADGWTVVDFKTDAELGRVGGGLSASGGALRARDRDGYRPACARTPLTRLAPLCQNANARPRVCIWIRPSASVAGLLHVVPLAGMPCDDDSHAQTRAPAHGRSPLRHRSADGAAVARRKPRYGIVGRRPERDGQVGEAGRQLLALRQRRSGIKRTEIPADRTSAGVGVLLVDEAERQVRTIVEDLARDAAKSGDDRSAGRRLLCSVDERGGD